ACLDIPKLSRIADSPCLLANADAVYVDRGARDDVFSFAGISAGILLVIPRRQAEGPLLPVGHHSPLGELSGEGLCVEDNSWYRWRAQHVATIFAPYPTPPGLSAVQPVCGGIDVDPHLHAVRVFADLRSARERPAQLDRSIARSRRLAGSNILARHSSAFDARRGCGRDVCLRAQPR